MDLAGLADVSHFVLLVVEHDQEVEEDFEDFDSSRLLRLDKRDSDVMSIDIVQFPSVCRHFDNQI